MNRLKDEKFWKELFSKIANIIVAILIVLICGMLVYKAVSSLYNNPIETIITTGAVIGLLLFIYALSYTPKVLAWIFRKILRDKPKE